MGALHIELLFEDSVSIQIPRESSHLIPNQAGVLVTPSSGVLPRTCGFAHAEAADKPGGYPHRRAPALHETPA